MEQEKQQQRQSIELPHEDLIQGVRKTVYNIQQAMKDAREKYGARYNKKNDYEEFGRRFGYDDPERLWHEFDLVWQKCSGEPASIRRVLLEIGNGARTYAIKKYLKAHAKPVTKKDVAAVERAEGGKEDAQ